MGLSEGISGCGWLSQPQQALPFPGMMADEFWALFLKSIGERVAPKSLPVCGSNPPAQGTISCPPEATLSSLFPPGLAD